MRSIRSLAAVAVAALFLAACGSSTTASTASSCSKYFKVGLVTDVGKLTDKSFNAASWQGVVNAQNNQSLCVQAKYIESNQPTDYQKNLQTFADQGYNMIVGVGFLMGDAVLAAAKANPTVKFAIVDYAYDSPPDNLTGLVFKEDQAGYVAGALAGLMTKSNTIGVVGGLKVPAVQRYVEGYAAGAKSTNPSIKVLSVYQGPSDGAPFNNPDWGKTQATAMIGQGADIIFGAGGNTGNGALLAANTASKMCIGVDVDQYLSYPDVDKCLLTSAEKMLSIAVQSIVTDAVTQKWPAQRTLTFDASNKGIGIAPYHNYDSQVPADVKAKITTIETQLASGSLSTGVNA